MQKIPSIEKDVFIIQSFEQTYDKLHVKVGFIVNLQVII